MISSTCTKIRTPPARPHELRRCFSAGATRESFPTREEHSSRVHCRNATPDFPSPLSGFQVPYLYALSVDSPDVTDASVPRICELKRLTILHLEWTSVSDQGIQDLCSLKNLRALGIGPGPTPDCKITDAALARLGELTSLEVLCLHGREFTDDAVPMLEKLKSLQELYLFSTSVTGAGVARLNSSLPKCMVFAGEE